MPRPTWPAPWAGSCDLDALRNPAFRLYFTGQLISQLGTWMQTVGLSWLVLRWTNSPKALGTVLACQFFPSLVLSLWGGVLADRMPKRKLLMTTQTVLLLQAAALAWVASLGGAHVYVLYGLALLAGLAEATDGPTRQSFVPELVTPAELPSAVALNSAQFNLSRMVGPALGGLVVARWGEAACFALNAASFLAVLLALAVMRVPPAPPQPPGDHDILAGLRYSLTSSSLSLVMGLAALMGVFALQFNAVLPLVARYELQTGSEGFGLLTSIVGVGSLVCALGIIVRGRGGAGTMTLGACGMGLCVLTLGLATHPAALYGALFLWGFCDILFFNTALMTIQLEARPDMRGRVNSLYLLLVNGTTPLGSLLVGYLAAHQGVAPALRILGGLCLAGTLLSVGWRTARGRS